MFRRFAQVTLAGLALALGLAAVAEAQNAPMQWTPQPGAPRPAAPAAPAPAGAVPLPLPRPADIPAAGQQTAPPPATATRPPAASAPAAAIAPGQAETLRRISEVYNGVREMAGQFTQVDGSTRTTGRFFITKPGRVRFQYDRPSNLDIIADGTDVVVVDRRLRTQELYPLQQTPLRYLLNERIDLARDAKVVDVSTERDLVSVTIEERGNFTQGQLTLYFDAQTYALRQWTITDQRGNETNVAVANVVTNQRNNPQLFVIDRTPQVGPRGNN